MLDGAQRRLQRHDRAGPFGGQDLGGVPAGALQFQAGALQLQGVLERLDTVPVGQGAGRVPWRLVLLPMPGWRRPPPVQAGLAYVLGRDPPVPLLTGDRARVLPGAGETPGAQVATDG